MMKRLACIVMAFIAIGLLISCGQEKKKTQQNDFDTKGIALIEEFYCKFVFAEYNNFYGKDEGVKEAILNSYCTKKMVQYLYWDEYDVPFYCLNGFVNGSQDYGIGDRITDIETLGDGKYKVHFINLQKKDYLIIKVVMDDGVLKMDEIIY